MVLLPVRGGRMHDPFLSTDGVVGETGEVVVVAVGLIRLCCVDSGWFW